MQFEVNGQNYFLQFSPEDGEWFWLRPSLDGLERLASADDSELVTEKLIPVDTDSGMTVN